MNLLKQIATSLIIGSTLVACADPNKEMKFDANIRRTSSENIILKTKITNYSDSDKTLNEIDINKFLHETLNLSRSDGSIGESIPIDNTYSYEINQTIKIYTYNSNNFITNYTGLLIKKRIECCYAE